MSEGESYPYPLRASELVAREGFFQKIEPIVLSAQGKEEVLTLDQELFNRLEPLKKLTPESYMVYPDFFLSDQGWRLFQLVYLDPDLEKRNEALAREKGMFLKSEKEKKRFFDTVFDQLQAAAASEEDFKRYKEKEGIEIKEVKRPVDQEEAVSLFFSLENLTEIPTQIRQRINSFSSDYARDQFLEKFRAQHGELAEVRDPYRCSRIVNVEKLIKKVGGYRELKREIKEIVRALKEEDDKLSEAKLALVQLYQRYLNVLIASSYPEGRLLASKPDLSEEEKQALSLIRGRRLETRGVDRFTDERASRTMEKIDHFLQGVGLKIGEDGLFETIPEKLHQFIKERVNSAGVPETPDYQKYNAFKVDARQAKGLVERVLASYGFDEQGWSVYISPTAETLSVGFRKKGEKVREVNIPENLNRNLIDFLGVLAHEVEGHVLRYSNQEQGIEEFNLIKEFSTGRSGILSEAGAMIVEDETKYQICQMRRPAKPYYGLVLLEKQRGGSFKDCFRTFLKAYAGGSEEDLKELMADKEKWQEARQYVYPRTLRIFRHQTPLNDRSGFLPISTQFKYLEQELVAQTLFEKGWGKILFVTGIDLYSIHDLQRLGILDWDKIQEPKLVVAKEIWPKIKEGLDQGKNLQETIEALI